MSRLQQALDILIQVRDKGIERLDKYSAGVKQLLIEESKLARAHGDLGRAADALSRLHRTLSGSISDSARKTLELTRVERMLTQVQGQQANQQRGQLLVAAELARRRGDMARAESLLAQALRQGTLSASQRLSIEQKLIAIQSQGQRAATAARNQAVQNTVAQARLATVTGQHAQAQNILNQAMRQGNLTAGQQTALIRAQAAAHNAAQRAAMAHANAQMRLHQQGGALSRMFQGLGSSFNTFTRLLASGVLIGFVGRTVFRFFDRVAISPLKSLFKDAVMVTDEFLRMQVAISGITGSLESAREVTRDIRSAIRAGNLPITTMEGVAAVQRTGFTPATAGMMQNPQGRVEGFEKLLTIISGLSTIDPEQGSMGAQFALREALAGEFRSLRFRFEISPAVIAAGIGKSLDQLKADPSLVIPALKKFVDDFVGAKTLAQFSDLLSTQGTLFKGVIQEFFLLVGESGIYDKARNFLRGINQSFSREMSGGPDGGPTPQALVVADRISGSLERLFDTVVGLGERLIQRLTGVELDFDAMGGGSGIEKFGEAVSRAVDGLADFAGKLFVAGERVLEVLGDLAKGVGGVFGSNLTTPDLDPESIKRSIRQLQELLAMDLDRRREFLSKRAMDNIGSFGGPKEALVKLFSSMGAPTGLMAEDIGLIPDTNKLLAELARRQRELEVFQLGSGTGMKDELGRSEEGPKKLMSFFREFSQGLNQLPQPSEQRTLLDQLHGLDTQLTGLMAEDSKYMQVRAQASERQRSLIEAARREFQIQDDDIEASLFEIAALSKDPLMAERAAGFRDAIKASTEAVDDLMGNMGAAISATQIGIIQDAAQSIGDFPPEMLVKNAVSLADSVVALLEATGDATAVGAAGMEEAMALFRGTQAGRGRFAGGVFSVLRENLPPGVEMNLGVQSLGFQGIKSISDILVDAAETASDKFPREFEIIEDAGERLFESLKAEIGELKETFADDPLSVQRLEMQLALVEDGLQRLKDTASSTAKQIQEIWGEAAASISSTMGAGLVDGLVDAFRTGGSEIEKIAAGMVDAVSRAVLDAIIQITLIRTIINPMLNAGFGLTGQNALPAGNLFGSARGNVFEKAGGMLQPVAFARGGMTGGINRFAGGGMGVINQPTTFPMAGGRMGQAGEQQTEIIARAERDMAGVLGLRVKGMPNGNNFNFHFSFPGGNAESFRRSMPQTMARAKQSAERAFQNN